MKKSQPIKSNVKKTVVKEIEKNLKKQKNKTTKKQRRQNYGTSKLEAYFAHNFLDKLGLKYIYQYEAKDIGRFFDFAITVYDEVPFITENKDGIYCLKQEGQIIPIAVIIEIDGGYYHSDPRVVNEKKLNPMQKHNKFVDFLKNKWCDLHGYPLLRLWEYDIKNNPQKVFDELHKYIGDGKRKKRIADNKKKPH
jgi:hypothetical protein